MEPGRSSQRHEIPMPTCSVSLVNPKLVPRLDGIEPAHQSVSKDLGHDGCRRNVKRRRIPSGQSLLRDASSVPAAGECSLEREASVEKRKLRIGFEPFERASSRNVAGRNDAHAVDLARRGTAHGPRRLGRDPCEERLSASGRQTLRVINSDPSCNPVPAKESAGRERDAPNDDRSGQRSAPCFIETGKSWKHSREQRSGAARSSNLAKPLRQGAVEGNEFSEPTSIGVLTSSRPGSRSDLLDVESPSRRNRPVKTGRS
jgi:hypothetical protein